MMGREFVTTGLTFQGYVIEQELGVVTGIVVRSRSVVGNFLAGLQTIFGGNISIYTRLCEQARNEAFEKMVHDAGGLGANAVIAFRFDATEIMSGVTEVLAYGTAVRLRPA
ncbi:YbjQ family protein [Chthonobacter albigriseus]|uniref:YbjQ family protein n=1 Tax=Chthonobacter albigriseus TaxID=1683161 RepID=UPI0015EE9ACE|nr:YbjQ family protein [Chthonobacter albigriseus]